MIRYETCEKSLEHADNSDTGALLKDDIEPTVSTGNGPSAVISDSKSLYARE